MGYNRFQVVPNILAGSDISMIFYQECNTVQYPDNINQLFKISGFFFSEMAEKISFDLRRIKKNTPAFLCGAQSNVNKTFASWRLSAAIS